MSIILTRARHEDIASVADLISDYILEMSAFMRGGALSTLQQENAFAMMTAYWDLDDHHPFLISCDDELVGFAFVRRYPEDNELYDMGQFFITDRFKGKGVGQAAFCQTLDKFPGEWLVRVLVDNGRAFRFWKKNIAAITRNEFSLTIKSEKNSQMHCFRFRAECN